MTRDGDGTFKINGPYRLNVGGTIEKGVIVNDEELRGFAKELINAGGLTPDELRILFLQLRGPTKPMVLVTTPARIPALNRLMGDLQEDGSVITYHGEILGGISVFTNEDFPPNTFRVILREQLAEWISVRQRPLTGLGDS